VSVSETAGTVTIPVVRIGGSDGAVSLNYTIVNASALAGSDYTLTGSEVVFLPGQTEASIVVPILNDGLDEGIETFNVATDQTTGGAIVGQPRTATITILDDDGPPTPGNGNSLLGAYYAGENQSQHELSDTPFAAAGFPASTAVQEEAFASFAICLEKKDFFLPADPAKLLAEDFYVALGEEDPLGFGSGLNLAL